MKKKECILNDSDILNEHDEKESSILEKIKFFFLQSTHNGEQIKN